jgi:hypothetical protein
MKLEILFLDDNQTELEKYSELFSSNPFAEKQFNFHTLLINTLDISQLRLDFKPDLFLIDFRFDLPGGEDTFYDGYVLSTALRNIYKEIPIVLFTRKDIFNIQKFPRNIIDIVDDIYYKNEFLIDELDYMVQIHSLITGYKRLEENKEKSWESLLKLIKAPKEAEFDLLNANKPIMNEGNWAVIDSANWIRKILLKYPGILYDELNVSTFLGISVDAFSKIQKGFEEALFTGIFRSNKKYYWKSLIRKTAVDLMNSQNISLPTHLGFSLAYQEVNGIKLDPSLCVYSGEENADRICYVLNKPVKTKYSFTYNIDNRPDVMDVARVSWKAIQTTNEVNEDSLNPVAKEMIPKIKANKGI